MSSAAFAPVEQRRVLIIEDQELFAHTLEIAIDRILRMEVVGCVPTIEDGKALARKQRPDLILLDVNLRGSESIVHIPELRAIRPRPRILMVSMLTDAEYLSKALSAGADGYFFKDQGFAELTRAIDAVLEGRRYVSSSAAAGYEGPAPSLGPFARLTDREREVLDLILAPNTNEEIAKTLDLSVRTVETHRNNIMRKLNVHRLVELARLAADYGLLRPVR
jgi:two-component system NarL family response regulator